MSLTLNLLRNSFQALRHQNRVRYLQNKNVLIFYRNFSNQSNPPSFLSSNPRNKIIGGAVLASLLGSAFYLYFKEPKKAQLKDTESQLSNDLKGNKSDIINERKLSSDIVVPEYVPFIIVGGGTAAFTASRAIRTKDPRARVLIITNENQLPYMRPPLTKEIWEKDPALQLESSSDIIFKQWNGHERSIFFEGDEYYLSPLETMLKENGGIGILKNAKVIKINPQAHKITLDSGHEISFSKCLIATGGTPKTLPVLESAPNEVKSKITTYRTVEDYKNLAKLITGKIESLTIIGGGFLGTELASSLSKHAEKYSFKINQIVPEPGLLSPILPEYLSDYATTKLKELNVNILTNAEVKSIDKSSNDKVKLHFNNGNEIETDHVIVALGIQPNDSLAYEAGFETDSKLGGFVVNSEFAICSDVWGAGDVASFYDPKLHCRRRLEHHDHAVVTGRLAGDNMAGSKKKYTHQSMFWSDITDQVSFEAVGLIDSSLPTVGIFAKPRTKEELMLEAKRPPPEELINEGGPEYFANPPQIPQKGDAYDTGIVFYLRDDIVVGVLLWNVLGKVSIARKIINEKRSFDDLTEVAKLFEINKPEGQLEDDSEE